MEQSELVKSFLADVVLEKKKQLMSIAMDLEYYRVVVGTDTEETLRAELQAEQDKRVIDKQGKILKDDRDMTKIQTLGDRIDAVVSAKQEILKYETMQKSVTEYYTNCLHPTDATLKMLEDIAALN